MKQDHLSTDRLEALYDEDLSDLAGLEHLASCADCRRAFDDSRWARLLTRLPGLVAAGSHPADAEIESYAAHALSSPRAVEIERHLRACESCLARAGRVRESEQLLQYRSPSPEALRSTMQRFRPRPLRRLGTVVVSALDRGARMLFVPGAPHPASASSRSRRLENRPEMPGIAQELAFCPSTDEPLTVCLGESELVLTPRVEPGGCRLDMKLISRDGRGRQGVRIRLRGAGGRDVDGVTDDDGRTSLVLALDATDLIVELDPAATLRLRFTD